MPSVKHGNLHQRQVVMELEGITLMVVEKLGKNELSCSHSWVEHAPWAYCLMKANCYDEARESLSSFLVLIFLYPFCNSLDNTITINHPIRDGDVLVSNGLGNFALGFFSPRNSTNRYVGIWYDKISEQTSCGLPTETLL
ncbi:hypothetical protein JHK85_019602 [Glycine max]|nr:hypothetical protein JHK85_019602 [Glycine max]